MKNLFYGYWARYEFDYSNRVEIDMVMTCELALKQNTFKAFTLMYV